MHKGAAALLWGEPAHDACQRFWLARAACSGVGGTLPPRLSPAQGETGKGESDSLLPQAISALPRDLFDSGEVVRNPSRSCSVISISDLAVQSSLNPFAPQDLKVVQRRFPVLDGLPLGDHIPQRQVQQLHGGFLARK